MCTPLLEFRLVMLLRASACVLVTPRVEFTTQVPRIRNAGKSRTLDGAPRCANFSSVFACFSGFRRICRRIRGDMKLVTTYVAGSTTHQRWYCTPHCTLMYMPTLASRCIKRIAERSLFRRVPAFVTLVRPSFRFASQQDDEHP